MTTKLDGVLKRELLIGGEPYTLTLSTEGFSLTVKGRRKGLDIRWADLVGGDAALATALNASLTANIEPRTRDGTKPDKNAARPGKGAAKPGKVAAPPPRIAARPTPRRPKRK
jgi:hypothetical protein